MTFQLGMLDGLSGRALGSLGHVPPAPSDPLIFNASLQASLIPERAGNGTPTFTRATTAYVQDWEGLLKPVLSGEARFTGARRVENRLSFTEALDNAAWMLANSGTGSVPVRTINYAAAPDGTVTAARLQADRGAGTTPDIDRSMVLHSTGSASVVAPTIVASVWLKSNTGSSQNVAIRTGFNITYTTLVVTTSWQRFSAVRTNGTGIQYYSIGANGSASDQVIDILYWHPQQENVTGQSNQNPSEYVSVGVLSAPYHGAGVDGVKYFTTLNGNTVASNVVTEAPGAAINTTNGASSLTCDAYGPFGYLAEGARTNVLLQSQTLGTTWTISNAADMNAVTADQYVAPDGTTTMDLLQPKATTAVHSLDQAFTFTAAVYTCSFYLRYVPATPQRWVALVLEDGTTTWAASFDLLNGAAGAVSNCTSTITATNDANVYRVTMTKSAAAAAAAGTVKISLNATDTASLESAARAGTETLGAWGGMLEAASFASSYVPTTTVAVARNADVLTYPLAGNISNSLGTAYAEVSFSNLTGIVNRYVIGSGATNGIVMDRITSTAIRMYDGTGVTDFAVASLAINTVVKMAARWSSVRDAFAAGAQGTPTGQAFDGYLGMTTLGIGVANSAAQFGTVRNVRIYSSALSAAQLAAMTT